MSKRARLVTAVAAVVTLAIGGVAYAAIPSSSGVIHACYKATPNPSGALRVINAETNVVCANNEMPLSWSQRGPQGLQGEQGPQGEQGAAGPAGTVATSAAFFESEPDFVDVDPIGTVLQLALPAGSYVIEARATVKNGDTRDSRQTAGCRLPGGAEGAVTLGPSTGLPGEFQQLEVTTAINLPAGGVVSLFCSGPEETKVGGATMLATPVGEVNP